MSETETTPAAPAPEPTTEDILATAVEKLMRATALGDADAATSGLSEAMSAFAVSTAARYEGGIPAEGDDYEIVRSETGLSVKSKTDNGQTLCTLWGEYTREMEYRALQQRVGMLSTVVANQQELLKRQQKQMDNMLVSFNQIRQKIRF